ncbi:MAG: 2-oxo acid dehydrogenase subunit E2, partial [Candidatus Bathyarchaeia archaeon]
PILNSTVEKDGIHIYDDVNVGVAVALEAGLIVPVVRKVESKVLHEVSAALNTLTEKARAGKLTIEDVSNGTFTVSNLGMFGVDAFTPITNPPQTAILGVGRIVDKPVVVESHVEIKPTVTLSLTIDHRAADGAVGAQFLQRVKNLLENPASLLL